MKGNISIGWEVSFCKYFEYLERNKWGTTEENLAIIENLREAGFECRQKMVYKNIKLIGSKFKFELF